MVGCRDCLQKVRPWRWGVGRRRRRRTALPTTRPLHCNKRSRRPGPLPSLQYLHTLPTSHTFSHCSPPHVPRLPSHSLAHTPHTNLPCRWSQEHSSTSCWEVGGGGGGGWGWLAARAGHTGARAAFPHPAHRIGGHGRRRGGRARRHNTGQTTRRNPSQDCARSRQGGSQRAGIGGSTEWYAHFVRGVVSGEWRWRRWQQQRRAWSTA